MARLIDSSVFIAFDRRGSPFSTMDAILSDEPFALASITASELLVGLHRSTGHGSRGRRIAFVASILGRVPVIAFDLDIARTHAHLIVDLAASGRLIGANDLLIASTALTRGYKLLTHNVRHFERVPGLTIEKADW